MERRADWSLGELFGDLAQNTSRLVRSEVELAKTELTEQATRVGRDVGILAAGGFIAYAGFLAILAGIVALLATRLGVWQSALIVGVIVAIVGGVLVLQGMNALKNRNLVPRQTIATLKEDVQWAKQQTH